MDKMTILFYGDKFAPGHQDVIWSYYSILSKEFDLAFCLNSDYYKHNREFYDERKTTYQLSSFDVAIQKNNTVVFIISPSKENIAIVKKCKKKNIKVIYIFHEPYSSFSDYYKKWGSTPKNLLKSFGLSYYNGKPLVNKVDGIILPSSNAYLLFQNNFSEKTFKSKKILCVPLMFSKRANYECPKKYISFIGNVDRIKNFDLFLDYLCNTKLELNFLIATSSTLSQDVINKLTSSGKKVKLKHGAKMSLEEIDGFYQQSYCTWLFYRDSTQSGVLPMCYKNGSAVLSSNVPGLVQNIINGVTGYVIDKYSVNTFDDCISNIIDNSPCFIEKTTEYFDNVFYYKNYVNEVLLFFKSFFKF